MASNTANLGLRKPEDADPVLVFSDVANNMQILDDKWTASAPEGLAPGDLSDPGASLVVARIGHKHALAAFGGNGDIVAVGGAASGGASPKFARADHVHPLPADGVPGSVVQSIKGGNFNGSSTNSVVNVVLRDVEVTTTGVCDIKLNGCITMSNDTNSQWVYLASRLDAGAAVDIATTILSGGGQYIAGSFSETWQNVAAGTHHVYLLWRVSGGNGAALLGNSLVEVIRRS